MLLWCDSFGNYGTTTNAAPSPAGVISRKYPVIANESVMRIRDGRLSGYAIDVMDSFGYLGKSNLTTNDTVVVGIAVKAASLSNSFPFLSLYDDATLGINLRFTTEGQIEVRRGGTVVLKTSTAAGLTINNWFYVELKVKCNSSTGTFEVRVGGVDVCSDTGQNTKAGTHDYHNGFRLSTNLAACSLCDLYVLDASGAINNDFLGNSRVVTIRPNAATGDVDFTPDSGDNYARVGEVICDDDTSYVESGTSTNKDLYGYAAIGLTADIAGVMVCTDCRETDASSFSIKTVCLSDATESADAGQAIGSTGYVTRSRVIEQDPDGPATWTHTSLDAAAFGMEVV